MSCVRTDCKHDFGLCDKPCHDDHEELTDTLQCLAEALMIQDADRQGRTTARWWCLRDELKDRWMRAAREHVAEWRRLEDERRAISSER